MDNKEELSLEERNRRAEQLRLEKLRRKKIGNFGNTGGMT